MEAESDRVSRLKKACERRRIDRLVCDLDDTVWDIRSGFTGSIRGASELINGSTGVGIDMVEGRIHEVIGGLNQSMSVDPSRLPCSVRVAAQWCGLSAGDEVIDRAIEEVMWVYEFTPRVFPGVREMLGLFQLADVEISAVTLARERWTQRKIGRTRLSGIFDQVVCLDVGRPKEEQWEGAYGDLRIDNSGRLMVMGDDYGKDIVPNLELGVRSLVLVLNGRERPRVVQDGVLVVEDTGGVVDAMLESW